MKHMKRVISSLAVIGTAGAIAIIAANSTSTPVRASKEAMEMVEAEKRTVSLDQKIKKTDGYDRETVGVTEDGKKLKITALSPGRTDITVTYTNGKTKRVPVDVEKSPISGELVNTVAAGPTPDYAVFKITNDSDNFFVNTTCLYSAYDKEGHRITSLEEKYETFAPHETKYVTSELDRDISEDDVPFVTGKAEVYTVTTMQKGRFYDLTERVKPEIIKGTDRIENGQFCPTVKIKNSTPHNAECDINYIFYDKNKKITQVISSNDVAESGQTKTEDTVNELYDNWDSYSMEYVSYGSPDSDEDDE